MCLPDQYYGASLFNFSISEVVPFGIKYIRTWPLLIALESAVPPDLDIGIIINELAPPIVYSKGVNGFHPDGDRSEEIIFAISIRTKACWDIQACSDAVYFYPDAVIVEAAGIIAHFHYILNITRRPGDRVCNVHAVKT